MTLEEIKQWAIENRKGLIVGAVAGFVLSRLLK
jgi:predicted negative regulator of RcsB-dependent stress response